MLNVENISYWERKSFFDNIDYLIIGAGIVGYSTALHLRKSNPNARILLIERGLLPSGASSKNAGFACFGSATELYDDLQHIDEDLVWNTVESRWKGLQYLKSIVGDEGLDLQINGSWDLITDKESELFEKTVEMLPYFNEKIKAITGEAEVYSVDENVSETFGFEKVNTSIYNRLEGQIDTSKMNSAFYKVIVANNIQVLFGIEAQSMNTVENRTIVQTSIGKINAGKVAICTNGFAKQFIQDEDIRPARAQVLVTQPIPDLKVEGTFHYNQGYYYFRNIDNRILFGGGRNLDFEGETTTSLSTSRLVMDKLEELLRTVILPNQIVKIDQTWAGIMGVGDTKKPIIKECSKNVYCGVRLGGMGVAIGTLVGKELSELMN
ncbi:MAG: FAD-dependent oxidoreductase [Crocinitomicaceae bacterium]|nr:FAD-dependent oxidoreductase [Crocinitomicaceae bacterium]